MTDVLSWIRLDGPFLIGHRGYTAYAPENSTLAFEAALEAGCAGVELDVRMTADEVLVVHHDLTLPGPDGPLRVDALTWEAIREGTFQGPRGPVRPERLENVLAALAGRCLINVEVKPVPAAHRDALAYRLDTALEAVKPRESVLVSSFDAEFLAALRRVSKEALLGFLFADTKDWNALEGDPLIDALTAMHPEHNLVDRKLVKRAQERGLQIHTWTVDNPNLVPELMDLGVTSIITNRPDTVGDPFWEGIPAGD